MKQPWGICIAIQVVETADYMRQRAAAAAMPTRAAVEAVHIINTSQPQPGLQSPQVCILKSPATQRHLVPCRLTGG